MKNLYVSHVSQWNKEIVAMLLYQNENVVVFVRQWQNQPTICKIHSDEFLKY
jgi:hypothetical protein